MFNLMVFVWMVVLATTSCRANFTAGQLAKIHAQAVPCSNQLAIPASRHLEERGELGDPTLRDESFKSFLFCVVLRLNVVDRQGNLRRDQLAKFVADGHDISKLPAVMDACTLKEGTPEDKALHFYQCYAGQKVFRF